MRSSKAILVSILLASAAVASAAGRVVSGVQGSPITQASKTESHPEIHKALRALRMAKDHLSDGAHDLGGHRVAAMKATEEGIRECEEALKLDK